MLNFGGVISGVPTGCEWTDVRLIFRNMIGNSRVKKKAPWVMQEEKRVQLEL